MFIRILFPKNLEIKQKRRGNIKNITSLLIVRAAFMAATRLMYRIYCIYLRSNAKEFEYWIFYGRLDTHFKNIIHRFLDARLQPTAIYLWKLLGALALHPFKNINSAKVVSNPANYI